MKSQSFLSFMLEAIGKKEEPIVEKKSTVTEVPEEKPIEQELIPVHIMDSDMKDSFFIIGHSDFSDFISRFMNNEYAYKVGGVFGSDAQEVNSGKPIWIEAFTSKATAAKKSKSAYYIDATDPLVTIKEAADRMRIDYPDLIIGF